MENGINTYRIRYLRDTSLQTAYVQGKNREEATKEFLNIFKNIAPEKIVSVVDIQENKETNIDLSKIVKIVVPVFALIFVATGLYFGWNYLKQKNVVEKAKYAYHVHGQEDKRRPECLDYGKIYKFRGKIVEKKYYRTQSLLALELDKTICTNPKGYSDGEIIVKYMQVSNGNRMARRYENENIEVKGSLYHAGEKNTNQFTKVLINVKDIERVESGKEPRVKAVMTKSKRKSAAYAVPNKSTNRSPSASKSSNKISETNYYDFSLSKQKIHKQVHSNQSTGDQHVNSERQELERLRAEKAAREKATGSAMVLDRGSEAESIKNEGANNRQVATESEDQKPKENTKSSRGQTPTTHYISDSDTAKKKNYNAIPSYAFNGRHAVEGTIEQASYYGPPGFGEDPKNDKRLTAYILKLKQPIEVVSSGNDELNHTAKSSEVQLIIHDLKQASKAINTHSTVLANGEFFSAHTGHHIRKLLMDVKSIDIKKKKIVNTNVSKSMTVIKSADDGRKTGALHKLIQTFKGDKRVVDSIAFSPDGDMIASGSHNGIIKLWDVETGQQIKTLREKGVESEQVMGIAFSPDGTKLVSAYWNWYIRIWDVKSGKLLNIISNGSEVCGVTFSPDATMIVSGDEGRGVSLWDAENGRLLKTLTGHIGCTDVASSPDGTVIASSGSEDAFAKLWDAQSGRLLKTFKDNNHIQGIVAFSPDGTLLAVGGGGGIFKLWDIKNGKLLKKFKGDTAAIRDIIFSPDGVMIASFGGRDRTIKLWDVHSGSLLDTIRGHRLYYGGLAFSPDGNKLAFGNNKDIILWDISSCRKLLSNKGHISNISEVRSVKMAKHKQIQNPRNTEEAAYADTKIYYAKITERDHYGARNQKLKDPAAILQQDRAIFYKYTTGDREDTGTGYFDTRSKRDKIKKMLARGSTSQRTLDTIRYGTPFVKVKIYKNYIDVSLVSGVSGEQQDQQLLQSSHMRNNQSVNPERQELERLRAEKAAREKASGNAIVPDRGSGAKSIKNESVDNSQAVTESAIQNLSEYTESPKSRIATHKKSPETYFARISRRDHYGRNNQKLKGAGTILQQDRANYHKHHRRDREDTGDSYFDTRSSRDKIRKMLARGSTSQKTLDAIRYGTPLVKVTIYENYIDVSLISGAAKKRRSASKNTKCNTVGYIRGISRHGDGFVAVRKGPGSEYRMVHKIYRNGEKVRICERKGKWKGVVFGDCITNNHMTRNGSCVGGWIYGKYVR